MIALLLREPGEEVVWVHLLEKDASCVAHSVNLCEVFYDFYRDSGEAAASEAIEDLRWLGVVERNDLDEPRRRNTTVLRPSRTRSTRRARRLSDYFHSITTDCSVQTPPTSGLPSAGAAILQFYGADRWAYWL